MESIKESGNGKVEQAIVAGATPLQAFHEEGSVEIQLKRAEKQIAFRKGILKLIAANINPENILLYGDEGKETLWLDKVACKQILSWSGARLEMDSSIQEKRYDGVEGPYIDFEVWGTVITGDGRAVRVMGNRSTYDDFYAKRNRYVCPTMENGEECGAITDYERGCPKHGKVRGIKESYYLPLDEVDIPSVKQAAITNLWNHAVEDLGFKPSLQELKDAGLDMRNRKRVQFGGDKKSSTQPQTSSTSSSVKPEASKGAAEPSTTQGKAAPTPSAKSATQKNNGKKAAETPIGKGIISEIRDKVTKPKNGRGGGTPFLEVIQNGHFLYCFKNSEIETSDAPAKTFDLIKLAKDRFCHFIIETKDGTKPMHSIVGARIVGRYQWDEQGQPISFRREPGDDNYQGTDEDIPY